MTKFEQVGVNFQYMAPTKKQAQKSFAYSCDCCCSKGMRIECDSCAIVQAHSLVMAYFDTKEGLTKGE